MSAAAPNHEQIAKGARENPLRLDTRATARIDAAIVEYWSGDFAAVRGALIAVEDIIIIIEAIDEAGAITPVTVDVLEQRIDFVRAALTRFLPLCEQAAR